MRLSPSLRTMKYSRKFEAELPRDPPPSQLSVDHHRSQFRHRPYRRRPRMSRILETLRTPMRHTTVRPTSQSATSYQPPTRPPPAQSLLSRVPIWVWVLGANEKASSRRPTSPTCSKSSSICGPPRASTNSCPGPGRPSSHTASSRPDAPNRAQEKIKLSEPWGQKTAYDELRCSHSYLSKPRPSATPPLKGLTMRQQDHVSIKEAMQAQFSAPWSWPAKRAFLRLSTMGRTPLSTMLVSSSTRPSSRKRVSPSQ